jgi:hypothetical protein
MFNYFKELLDKFAGHQFRAQWQNEQLSSLRENLLPNHCVVIHDYSENYGCKEKFELQQTYFQRTEVSIHVSVIYRHAEIVVMFSANVFNKSKTISRFILNGASVCEFVYYFHVILNRV